MHSISHTSDKKSRLKRKLEFVPEKPGVYLHKNAQNEILYVGKAKNLKNRLKSYFGAKDHQSHKTQLLIEHIEDFDFILTKNEYESIVAENNLIKHHKPRYNILLKDSKTYPYLKIDLHDKWPQLVFTRRKKDDGALYFGPYSNIGDLDKILRVIQKFFPLVRCAKHTFKTVTRPCNYYHVGQCLAPCHLKVNRDEYLEIVQSVISLLKGKTKDVISKIKLEMVTASENLNFEKAAKLRDSIKALESISEEQSVDLNNSINIDFIAFIEKDEHCVFYVSHVRDGIFIGTDSFVHSMPKNISSEDVLSALIFQFYDTHQEPETTQASENGNANNALFTFCINYDDKKLFLKKLSVTKETRNKILHLIELTTNNATWKLDEKIKTHSSAYEKMLGVQKLLNLKELPKRIECYDISTLQGTHTVASRVVFKDGLPCKSLYRKYIIKEHLNKMDDFSSLKEVLGRRLKNYDPAENKPENQNNDQDNSRIDLLMLDGGTPQVREVGHLLKALGLENICLVGLAKQRTERNFKDSSVQTSQERLVIPARDSNGQLMPLDPPQTIELDPHSKAFQLLVSIRDEAHRFAITFHRKRRGMNRL